MPSILGRILTNSFDPSAALGDALGWFLQLLALQVVTSELGEIIAFHNSCGTFLSPALISYGSLWTAAPLPGKKNRTWLIIFLRGPLKKEIKISQDFVSTFLLCLHTLYLTFYSLFFFFYLFLRKKLKVLSMFITSIF